MDSLFDALEQRPHFFPCLFSALLLLVGLGSWSSTYYTLVYWVTMIIPSGVALLALFWRQFVWVPGLIFLALIFNPIEHFSLGVTLWKVMDVIGGGYMLTVAVAIKKPGAKRESSDSLIAPVTAFALSLVFLIYALWKL
ncbi:MAG: hypothetical protein A3F84_12195 [Candidatus Handelsmanbacteria bacterium RIFCSPLOWO2_12_FULL_64_10]|uniref:Uncharacterized protein n=1 Tax=Handelsmanbacteria sp. (strain RIFCSPLOWO2_12_FULL_64_10) TaxID=1817868 RepID=A0A1F6C998_HANXR|nr:MAG: hypothetical protein A3F84_12195 [Candidatus Handelsmanbacteria bacterium RIFCSPLOWO2_12_FULL_64_10]